MANNAFARVKCEERGYMEGYKIFQKDCVILIQNLEIFSIDAKYAWVNTVDRYFVRPRSVWWFSESKVEVEVHHYVWINNCARMQIIRFS